MYMGVAKNRGREKGGGLPAEWGAQCAVLPGPESASPAETKSQTFNPLSRQEPRPCKFYSYLFIYFYF